MITYFDGYIVASNLLENTPGATASLVQKFSSKNKNIPYYIDPMTYVFGCYHDPNTKNLRKDLDWIKSEQKKSKLIIRDFKSSYRKVGEKFGGPFANAVEDAAKKDSALMPDHFSDSHIIEDACKKITDYQKNCISKALQTSLSSEEWEFFKGKIPLPNAIFAPYFYIEPNYQPKNWLKLNIDFIRGTVDHVKDIPVHAILCFDSSALLDNNFISEMITEVKSSQVQGVWLWISKLNEDNISDSNLKDKLLSLRKIVEQLSGDSLKIYNMHGGFFSLALSKFGMSGISHGIGYGEQKDVVPVIGQATPIVRYYLPALHRRLGITEIELCFRKLEIKTPEDFYNKICNCTICKGIMENGIDQFAKFGEMNPIKPGNIKSSQTPTAAKLCRFHFLLCRINERDEMKNLKIENLLQLLDDTNKHWSGFDHIHKYREHISIWASVLK
ncbi:MAG: hypothetical protein LBE13_12195 [Bacteroidales bacterium]|nr:hypothetical protein [Bacteroidales bacterium]